MTPFKKKLKGIADTAKFNMAMLTDPIAVQAVADQASKDLDEALHQEIAKGDAELAQKLAELDIKLARDQRTIVMVGAAVFVLLMMIIILL